MESGAIKKLYRKTIYFILTVINSTAMTQYPYHQYNMGILTGIMFTVHTDNTTLYLEKSECLCVGLASLIDEWSLSQLEGGILRSVFDCSSWKWTGNSTWSKLPGQFVLKEGKQTHQWPQQRRLERAWAPHPIATNTHFKKIWQLPLIPPFTQAPPHENFKEPPLTSTNLHYSLTPWPSLSMNQLRLHNKHNTTCLWTLDNSRGVNAHVLRVPQGSLKQQVLRVSLIPLCSTNSGLPDGAEDSRWRTRQGLRGGDDQGTHHAGVQSDAVPLPNATLKLLVILLHCLQHELTSWGLPCPALNWLT